MKKGAVIYFVFFILFFTSCRTYVYTAPSLGLWKSEHPYIEFEVTNEGRGFYGILNNYNNVKKIIIVFSAFNSSLTIYDAFIDRGDEIITDSEYELMSGEYRLCDSKIYFTLRRHWAEVHGVNEIIFNLVTDN